MVVSPSAYVGLNIYRKNVHSMNNIKYTDIICE